VKHVDNIERLVSSVGGGGGGVGGEGRGPGALAVERIVAQIGEETWHDALRWARGGFVTRGLPACEDYRTSLRMRMQAWDERARRGAEGCAMADGSSEEAEGVGGGGNGEEGEVMVEYEQQRLARIQSNLRALEGVGLGAPPVVNEGGASPAAAGGGDRSQGAEGVGLCPGEEDNRLAPEEVRWEGAQGGPGPLVSLLLLARALCLSDFGSSSRMSLHPCTLLTRHHLL